MSTSSQRTVYSVSHCFQLNKSFSAYMTSSRRPKKKRNIQNDTRIKASIQRFDSGAYTRLQFLRAMCHCLGAHTEAFQFASDAVTTTLTMEPTLSLLMMQLRSGTQQPILTMPLSRQATTLLSCARCAFLHPAQVSPSCPAVTPVSVLPVLTQSPPWTADVQFAAPQYRWFCVYLTSGQLNDCERFLVYAAGFV